jgi:hypothetical protein
VVQVDGFPSKPKDGRVQALKELFEKAGVTISMGTGVKVNEARYNFMPETQSEVLPRGHIERRVGL